MEEKSTVEESPGVHKGVLVLDLNTSGQGPDVDLKATADRVGRRTISASTLY
jgi:hypothetical protein